MDELIRLLDVVTRELGADDARAELGGKDPKDVTRHVFARLGKNWRVVAIFEKPLLDAEEKRQRLEALLSPFREATTSKHESIAGTDHAEHILRQRELTEMLEGLRKRAGARAALVIDDRSPVLWGRCAGWSNAWDVGVLGALHRFATDVDSMDEAIQHLLGNADSDDGELATHAARLRDVVGDLDADAWEDAVRSAHAVQRVREACGERAPERFAETEPRWGVFARSFAQLYLVLLVYDGAYSELGAEGPLVRALPGIESLVLALPPVDPPPKGAKVLRLI